AGRPGRELARAEPRYVGEVCLAEVPRRERRDHVTRLRLRRVLAHLGEVSRLVHHPALLPAHAERARLAGVARAEPAVEAEEAARLAALAQHVGDGGEAAPRSDPRTRHGAGG